MTPHRTEHEAMTPHRTEHEAVTPHRTEHENVTPHRTEHEAMTPHRTQYLIKLYQFYGGKVSQWMVAKIVRRKIAGYV